MKELEALPSVRTMATNVASRIATQSFSPFEAMLKFCELCKTLRTNDLVCDMHKGFINVPAACDVCQSL